MTSIDLRRNFATTTVLLISNLAPPLAFISSKIPVRRGSGVFRPCRQIIRLISSEILAQGDADIRTALLTKFGIHDHAVKNVNLDCHGTALSSKRLARADKNAISDIAPESYGSVVSRFPFDTEHIQTGRATQYVKWPRAASEKRCYPSGQLDCLGPGEGLPGFAEQNPRQDLVLRQRGR
jgi:hypothetical protein